MNKEMVHNLKIYRAEQAYCSAGLSLLKLIYPDKYFRLGYLLAFTDEYYYPDSPSEPEEDHPAHFISELMSREYMSYYEIQALEYELGLRNFEEEPQITHIGWS